MGDAPENKPVKNICIGILAHVDAGKTTLSEAMLYESGTIREMGRVDKGSSYLDTNTLERARGITIFSKQAILNMGGDRVTLLDTPGHVDFSTEMERTLQVLDYAVLVISGTDGVQAHTETLWKLLKQYGIPVFLFINKMDRQEAEKERLLETLKKRLHENCIDFSGQQEKKFYENIAMCEEAALEEFLETGKVNECKMAELIAERKLFPCFFGSALRLQGIREMMDGIGNLTRQKNYPIEFGARVFKVARDEQGSRLTFMKITGGSLQVKSVLNEEQEKVNQIRFYSGDKYTVEAEAPAGSICAVTGLKSARPGQGLGREKTLPAPILEPVLTYSIQLPEECEAAVMLPKIRQLEEEDPALRIVWNEEGREIQAQLMGEVQIEVLQDMIRERFGIEAAFGAGNIVYKETITDIAEGVGHYEPLRHYAEVHLLLEPGEPGSGMTYASCASEDDLDRNWQRLIMTHLEEKQHRGVLTGSVLTDVKITLAAGRAHQKHTEGGDFRQATYRAVRQGLKQVHSVLLEPYYQFRMELPTETVGKAMTDIEKMGGTMDPPQIEENLTILTGSAPVAGMQGYQTELNAYSKGQGKLFCVLKGYEPCHNSQEVIERKGYDPEKDMDNPAGSVFCAHGAGFAVSWEQVKDYMHLESFLPDEGREVGEGEAVRSRAAFPGRQEEKWIGTEEVDAILERTFYANKKADKGERNGYSRVIRAAEQAPVYHKPVPKREKYLLVDGYNIIFAWQELKELAEINVDSARGRLMDILCNYQAIMGIRLILVFDAYRVQGHVTEIMDYHNIHVVYTKEAETADQYIEKFAHENGRKYDITVATSDGLEQIITRGQGCSLLSARELQEEIARTEEVLRVEFEERKQRGKNYLLDSLPEEEICRIKKYDNQEMET